MVSQSQRRTFSSASGEGPLVLAHRGASVLETENTLVAFRRAMADGADGVELDVQRCATGEVVVFHDDDLKRLAGRPERIDQLSLAALRQVRLLPGGEIPTLAEALEACGPAGLVNIEIKHTGLFPTGCRALVEGVAGVVARADAGHRVLISSFSPGAVWGWRKLRTDVPSRRGCVPARMNRVDGGGWRRKSFSRKSAARAWAERLSQTARMEKESSSTTMSGRVDCGNCQCGPAAATTSSSSPNNSRKKSRGSCSRWILAPPGLDWT